MHMRRVFAIVISSFFVMMSVFAGTALADDDSVTISNITVSPSSLSGGGQVIVTANVAVDINRAEGGINNVYIDGAGVVKPAPVVGGIQVADKQDVSCTLNVQDSQLGSEIPLTLKWDGGQASFSVVVNSSAPTVPQVSFTRTVDKTTADMGETVTLIYRVENKGSVDISSLSISDSGVKPDALRTKDVLAAGSSFEFTYSYTMDADFTSVPKLTYIAGGTTYSATYPSKTVSLKVEQLDALLEFNPSTITSGNPVMLQCTVTNSGNEKLSDVVIGENTLGSKLFPAFSIDTGVSKSFTWTASLTKTMKFQFLLTAKDAAGQTYTFKSNEIEVTVSSASGLYDIGFTASSDAIRLSEPGDANFSLSINNRGTAPVANVNVVDQDGAVVKTFGTLPVGQTAFKFKVAVDKTKEYNFCIVVPNGDGTNYQVYTGPMKIEVAEATAAPTQTPRITPQPTPAATETANSAGSLGKMGSLITALLVIGVLIAITIIVLIAMIISDRKRRKR